MQNYKHVFTEQEREAMEQEREAIKKDIEVIKKQFYGLVEEGNGIKKKCVYAVKFENGFVNIGIAYYPKHRLKRLSLPSGRTVLSFFISGPLSNLSEAESIIRETFKKNQIDEDLYRINFERCVFIMKKLLYPDKYESNIQRKKKSHGV